MSNGPKRGIKNVLRRNKRIEEEKKDTSVRDLEFVRDSPVLRQIKPKQRYIFRSDYFEIDRSYATILTIMHHEGSDDKLGPFWGIQLIPRSMGTNVTIRKLDTSVECQSHGLTHIRVVLKGL